MKRGIEKLYDNRRNFIVIGLTGRTGSGCSTTANILKKELCDINLPTPVALDNKIKHNEERKYQIAYNYFSENWRPFQLLRITDVITASILENSFEEFDKFVCNTIEKTACNISTNLDEIKEQYNHLHNDQCLSIYQDIFQKKKSIKDLSSAEIASLKNFFLKEIPEFTDQLKRILNNSTGEGENYTIIYQTVGDNIRSSGKALDKKYNPDFITSTASRVNILIKVLKAYNKDLGKPTFVVIDAIRNPFEAHFFKERYSAFYLIAINTDNNDRIKRLNNLTLEQLKKIDLKEYPIKLEGEDNYISQNIQACLQLADIHINNPTEEVLDHTELKKQLVKFVSLILHPGIITPTPVERSMQIALISKFNSGCISRQVGAVVTDEFYSLRSIGWNNTSEGQVPCVLRNAEALIKNQDKTAFSYYENTNEEFRDLLTTSYNNSLQVEQGNDAKKALKGRNISFCFKDFQNALDDQKNQVHTRSLHAEENAFLQIAKYGGEGLKNGFLFTTASPCELCAKKAYQLGIQKIYYIDPYPGIANTHILNTGSKKPKLQLFTGAVGRAYHHLYQPFMAYKDELKILLDLKIVNRKEEDRKSIKNNLNEANQEIERLREELASKNALLNTMNNKNVIDKNTNKLV